MVLRDELNRYLAELYGFANYEDYCLNGLQVEGKERIEKILFGVSFNLHLIEKAIEKKADAIIVHHGIFDKGFFVLKGHKKKKVKMLLDYGMSLFGIHLPMDGHPELGHNALLLAAIGSRPLESFEVGFIGKNDKGHNIDQMVDIFHKELHVGGAEENKIEDSLFSLSKRKGFTTLGNGPEIPEKIAVISGGAANLYERAIETGVDTFICGEIKEHIPALSYETGTNFINLGHYNSEKPGVLKLMTHIKENFDAAVEYVDIPNPV
jgi:dinuclear metal center YbgI/SA1388 family protein